MLSAGLFIGSAGGAIALADTESTGSPAQSEGAEGPIADAGAASAPANKVAHPLRTTLQLTVQGVTGTLRSLQKLGQQQSTALKAAQTEPANTDGDNEGSGPTLVDPSTAASDGVESDQALVAPDSTVIPDGTDSLAAAVTVVKPVANAVATVASVVGSVPALVASLPASETPVSDVITSVQEMLTSVSNALVPLTQLPSDLYTLLAVPAATAVTSVNDAGLISGAPAPMLGKRASQWLEVPPIFLVEGVPLADNIAPLGSLGDIATTGLQNQLPVSGVASPAQNAIVQTGLGAFLKHTVAALFVPASLSALAAVALPGVGGLLIICALGVRIGYRQAKALVEVRRTGIASFAGPGPLGVVRSGSLIALRPRATRVVRPHAPRAVGLLHQAA